MRSREISACLVLQVQSQLKAIYKDNADTIIGNMDTRIFHGGLGPTALKGLSAALGKETIDMFNTGVSKGILQLWGVRPFLPENTLYCLTITELFQYI